MSASEASGYFRCGLPYNRLGHGARPLVVFQGLLFENKPSAMMLGTYRFLAEEYTVYVVLRKPGLPRGYTLKDMAEDYATLIREELDGPLDVIGVSTGGSIVQHFAADHPELVRHLVIHSSAYVLSEKARALQMRTARLAEQHRWADAYAAMIEAMAPAEGAKGLLLRPLIWLGSRLASLGAPRDPNDLVVTVEAEDTHNFRDRLAEITAPTLVIAGDRDPFYTPPLFRETAAGIPGARLILYPGMGHPASGKQFARDVLAFLRTEA